MQEKHVTVAGSTYTVDEPFMVLATQNPLEMEGTYPLPEAQLDRFFFKLRVTYPTAEDLHTILDRTTATEAPRISRVLEASDVLAMRQVVRDVPMTRGDPNLCHRSRARHASRYRGRLAAGAQVRPLWCQPARRPGVDPGGEKYTRCSMGVTTSLARTSPKPPCRRCGTGSSSTSRAKRRARPARTSCARFWPRLPDCSHDTPLPYP